MFNPYIIILSLFIIAGLFATFWGWRIIREGKKTLSWPKAQGSISKVEATSKADDLLPRIEFSYRVNDKDYQCPLNFPDSVSPSQELTNQYLKKYPVGTNVQVSYNHDKPEISTIEPGIANGDWFVFVLGILTVIFGVIFLFVSN
jgi:hypothetical protein